MGLYWYIMLTLMMAIAGAPAVLATAFLDANYPSNPINAVVIIVAGLFLGPTLSAGLYACRARTKDETPLPTRAFWRGYKMNAADVLRLWLPTCLVVAIIAFTLGNAATAGIGLAYAIGLIAIASGVTLWGMHALMLATFFTFRSRDIARLAVYYLGRNRKSSLGVLALIIVAGGIVGLVPGGIFALAVASGLWTGLWWLNVTAIIADATERFTADPRPGTSASTRPGSSAHNRPGAPG